MENFTERKTPAGLYSPRFEHDNCGIGAVVDIKGRKSHKTIDDALQIVEHLEHRAGKDAEGKTGDSVGILLQISHKFFSKVAEELNIILGNEREYGVGMFFFPQSEHLRAQAMKLPPFLSPVVVAALQQKYDLKAVTTPENDLQAILGRH